MIGAAGATAASIITRRLPHLALLAVLALGLGLFRAGLAYSEAPPRWIPPSERMRIQATIDAPVDTRGTTALVYAHIDRVLEPAGAQVPPGRIRASVPGLSPLQPGQRIEITGRIEPVEPTSSTGARLAREGVVATTGFPRLVALGPAEDTPLARGLRGLRSTIEVTIQRALPEPHAALLAGLLVGSSSSMPESLRLALVGSGTTHLVVVSGYNIALMAETELLP